MSIERLPLTFYGHFTGNSSYPVVCNEIAKWMISRGVDLRVVNLRGGALHGDLGVRQIPIGDTTRIGVGMLFGFPSWYPEIPIHSHMIGYHVGDVLPLPQSWRIIRDRCDTVITASRWCQNLLRDIGIDAKVVNHGINPGIFTPDLKGCHDDKIVLRHFCSSPSLDRKGTIEVLTAAKELFGCVDEDVTIRVSVPLDVYALVSMDYSSHFGKGNIDIVIDDPRDQKDMAKELREATAVIQPSRAEGFGMIPLEAVACGTPVVITDDTGHQEYSEDLDGSALIVGTGRFFPCSGGLAPSLDQGSLVRSMVRAVKERRDLHRIAREVSPSVQKYWSWETVLDEDLLPILDSL